MKYMRWVTWSSPVTLNVNKVYLGKISREINSWYDIWFPLLLVPTHYRYSLQLTFKLISKHVATRVTRHNNWELGLIGFLTAKYIRFGLLRKGDPWYTTLGTLPNHVLISYQSTCEQITLLTQTYNHFSVLNSSLSWSRDQTRNFGGNT